MKSSGKEGLTVGELFESLGEELGLKTAAGSRGFGRLISSGEVNRPGAAAGLGKKCGVKILGRAELKRLGSMAKDEEKEFASHLKSGDIPCFIVSKGLSIEEKTLKLFNKTNTPLFTTSLFTGKLVTVLERALIDKVAPFTTAHGVLIEVSGVGLLILGESGKGKSESALDLIYRGSKLISDDVVEIRKSSSGTLSGKGPRHTTHLMEIRGVGIINIKDLFGKRSVMNERELEMVIELVQWNPEMEYDRLGLDAKSTAILGEELPYLKIPVSQGRNTATIIEVAVRNEKLKQNGVYSAQNFREEHEKLLSKKKSK